MPSWYHVFILGLGITIFALQIIIIRMTPPSKKKQIGGWVVAVAGAFFALLGLLSLLP